MRKTLLFGAVFLILAASQSARAQDKALIDAGVEIYNMHCAECHGERLVNTGSAFDLKTLGADERARFDKSVMEGKDQMPAWRGTLKQEDLDKLWAYIRSRADN